MSSDDDASPIYAAFFAAMGAALAMTFSTLGAAYGTAKSAIGITDMSAVRPDFIMKSLIPVVMAGIVGIYGLVMAVLIADKMHFGMTLHESFLLFGAGISVGLSGLSAGYAIGVIGETGTRGTAQQPKLYVGMILNLIFAGVPGLYGLIVGLVLITQS